MKILSEKQYEIVRPYMPVQRGNVRIPNLDVINAVLYVAENGCKWRALPKVFGNGQRFTRAFILTKVDAAFAGRVYAAYGGVYIVASLTWLRFIERQRPFISDYLGGALCLIGAAIILLGARLSEG